MSILDDIRAAQNTAAEALIDPANIKVPQSFDEAYKAHTRATRPQQVPGMMVGAPAAAGAAPPTYIQAPVQSPTPGEGGFGMSLKEGMIDDPEATLRMLSDSTGIPLQDMGFINNEPVFVNRTEEGGWHFQGFSDGPGAAAGTVTASMPEVAGSIAGGILGAARSGRPDVGSATGAMGGLAIKKWLANLLWDDPIGVGDLGELALEGALDYGGAKLMRKGGKLLRREGISGLDSLDESVVAGQKESIKQATGIDLDIAQLTNLPQLKALKIWARNYPGEAGEVIRVHDEMVNGQSAAAIARLADSIARSSDPAAVGLKGVSAANAAIGMARAEVDRIADPLYREAFERAQGQVIDTKPILSQLDKMMEFAKGKELAWLKEARKAFMQNKPVRRPKTKNGKVVTKDGQPVMEEVALPEETLEGLHKTKLALDAMLDRKPGDDALSKTAHRDITLLKERLVNRETGILPQASPDYAQAMDQFAKASRVLVEPLENSVVGVLAKIPDHNAVKAAATLFSGGRATPLGISRARRAFERVERQFPQHRGSWDRLTADWLRQNLNQAMKPTQAGETPNIAGKWLQKAFGTPEQQAALKAALGPDAYGNLVMVSNALKMAARTPTGSSATEFNRLITEQMGEGAVTFLQRVLRPRGAAMDAMQSKQLDTMSQAMAQALTNPDQMKQLRKIKAMPAGQERNLAILGAVFASAIQSGAQELTESVEEGMTAQ